MIFLDFFLIFLIPSVFPSSSSHQPLHPTRTPAGENHPSLRKKEQRCPQFLWKNPWNPFFYGKLWGYSSGAHQYKTIGLTNLEEQKICAHRGQKFPCAASVQLCQIFPVCPCDPTKVSKTGTRAEIRPRAAAWKWLSMGSGFHPVPFSSFLGTRVDPAKCWKCFFQAVRILLGLHPSGQRYPWIDVTSAGAALVWIRPWVPFQGLCGCIKHSLKALPEPQFTDN